MRRTDKPMTAEEFSAEAVLENLRLGYFERAGTNADGEQLYRITDKGRRYVEGRLEERSKARARPRAKGRSPRSEDRASDMRVERARQELVKILGPLDLLTRRNVLRQVAKRLNIPLNARMLALLGEGE